MVNCKCYSYIPSMRIFVVVLKKNLNARKFNIYCSYYMSYLGLA
jgi:hypothetical protein